MDSERIAFCYKKLDEAKDRLAFLEYFEKHVKELNHQRLSELRKIRQEEVARWERELQKARQGT